MTWWMLVVLNAVPFPPGLACLQRHYPVTAVTLPNGGFAARTADGVVMPWNGAAPGATLEEVLNAPGLSDLYVPTYQTGPIMPVETVDHDPGRVRVAALLDAAYGARVGPKDLVDVVLGGHRYQVHAKVAPALRRVAQRVDVLVAQDPSLRVFLEGPGGGFNPRVIAGTTRRSAHSWGVAVDLSTAQSHYWRWVVNGGQRRWNNRFPQVLVDAFESQGFIWGGRWYHFDTMHFEYRPELLDPACQAPVQLLQVRKDGGG
jgi:hypothetical protein